MASIDQLPNGKYRVQVRTAGFKPQTKSTFKRHADAVAWARKIEGDQQRGDVTDLAGQRSSTVRDLLLRFEREELPSRPGRRWEAIRIRLFVSEDFSHRRLDQDIPEALRRWVDRRVKAVSAATVRRDLALLSGVFSKAIRKWGVPLRENPVSRIERPHAEKSTIAETWSAEDLAAFKDAFAQFRAAHPPRKLEKGSASWAYILLALELAIETSARRSELCSIELRNIDLAGRSIWLETTKNGEGRYLSLSSRAVEIVEELLRIPKPVSETKLIPVTPDTLGLRFRLVRNWAGLKLRLHDARHTAVTNAAPKLGDPLSLARFSGHKDPRILLHYFRPTPADLAKKLG